MTDVVKEKIEFLKKYKVLKDYVVVYVPHDVEKIVNGIIVPGDAHLNGPMVTGYVVGHGPGLKDSNGDACGMELSVGDKIWIHRASTGSTSKFGNELFILIRQNEVFAIIED